MENGGGANNVTFMQFCSMVAKFTKNVSSSLDTIHQLVLYLHQIDKGDDEWKEREITLNEEITDLRESTAGVLVVLKNNFLIIRHLPPSQQLVLNYCTALIKLIIAFGNSAKKLEGKDVIDKLYKDVLGSAKQAVSAINFSLKGIF